MAHGSAPSRGRRLPVRCSAGAVAWLVGLVGVPALVYLMLCRTSVAVIVLPLLIALPAAFTRPDLTALGLVPASVLSALHPHGGVALTAAAVLLAVGCVSARWVGRATAHPPVRPWVPVTAGTLAAVLLASAVAGRGATRLSVDLAGLLLGLLVAAALAVTPPQPAALARVLVLTGALAAAIVLHAGADDAGRLVGLTLNPNYLGAVFAAPIAAGIGLARFGRPVWLLPCLPCLVALLRTESRGALIATVIGGAVALVAGRPLRQQAYWAAAAAVVGGLAVVVPGALRDAALGGRTSLELADNNEIRATAARVAAAAAVHHPLLGIGYGRFPDFAMADPRLGIVINTHNDYLRLAAESGTAALALFLVLLVAALTARVDPVTAPLRAAATAGAVNLLFANCLANLVVSGGFWICLGCLLAHRVNARRGTDGSTEGKQPCPTPAPAPRSRQGSASPSGETGVPSSVWLTRSASMPPYGR